MIIEIPAKAVQPIAHPLGSLVVMIYLLICFGNLVENQPCEGWQIRIFQIFFAKSYCHPSQTVFYYLRKV
jgi:hypothetical protein